MKQLIVVVAALALVFIIYRAVVASRGETKEVQTVRSLPPSVQHVVAQMDARSQAAFFNEYARRKKSTVVGWILWFPFGFHYIYARKVGLQFLYWFTLDGLGIWMLIDLFRMPSIIRGVNEQIAREVLQTLHVGVAFAAMPRAVASMQQPVAQFQARAMTSPSIAVPRSEPTTSMPSTWRVPSVVTPIATTVA